MKIELVEFMTPRNFPGARTERVLSMDNPAHARTFGLELDPRGFVRVTILEGTGKGKVALVGPMHVSLVIASFEAAQTAAKK